MKFVCDTNITSVRAQRHIWRIQVVQHAEDSIFRGTEFNGKWMNAGVSVLAQAGRLPSMALS